MQKITPHLWFDTQAEEAVHFYASIFKEGKIINLTRFPGVGQEIHGMPEGMVMNIEFEIWGYRFMALNGGPIFKFTPAISFMVNCASKEEVDELWSKLSEGGKVRMPLEAYPFSERYGWTDDKYGVSWQIGVFEDKTRQIFPSLMYVGEQAGRAEEAIDLYTSIFPDSSKGMMARYSAGQDPDKEGTLMYADFILAGQKFAAMDSAREHAFNFNEAVSFLVICRDQAELDKLWSQLSAVPEAEQCGWLKDKFGVSWQIAPEGMNEVLNNPDKEKANRAMAAMLKMKKLNLDELQKAADGE